MLNRYLGGTLLEYAKDGAIPKLAADRTDSLIARLRQSLRLQDPDIELTSVSGQQNRWTVSNGAESVTFGARSCLRVSQTDPDISFDVSDYELAHELPEIATRLTEELE